MLTAALFALVSRGHAQLESVQAGQFVSGTQQALQNNDDRQFTDELRDIGGTGLTAADLGPWFNNVPQAVAHQRAAELHDAISRALSATLSLHQKYPSTMGSCNGDYSNVQDTLKAPIEIFSKKENTLPRGCLSHQNSVDLVLGGRYRSLTVSKVQIGYGLEHHAVVVYPNGSDWKKAGVVFDGWLKQDCVISASDMTYGIAEWSRAKTSFPALEKVHFDLEN